MKIKNFAFTLSELLIALGVLGILAGLTIPSLAKNIQNKKLSAQYKNTYAEIKHTIDSQLILKKTNYLSDTDFGNLNLLFNETNFAISRYCEQPSDCWKNSYKKISDKSFITEASDDVVFTTNNSKSVKLKNGSVIGFAYVDDYPALSFDSNDSAYGIFKLDVNGDDGPNFLGRDYFAFLVSRKGKIYSYYTLNNQTNNDTVDKLKDDCINGELITSCSSYLQKKDWEIDY